MCRAPEGFPPDRSATAATWLEVTLAEHAPIPILPHIEGPDGSACRERFLEKVKRGGPDDCWEWTASRTHNGYGRFKIASWKTVHANRVAWALEHGTDPGDLIVRHSCDNPPCCNPAHLLLGTVADNNADKLERGRHRNGKLGGVRNPMARLTEADVADIVRRLKNHESNMSIATHHKVGHALVSRIRVGRSWQREAAKLGWNPLSRLNSEGAVS